MRSFTSMAVLALVAVVAAIPITPAAPGHQRHAELMRMAGMNEHDIAAHLALPLQVHYEEHQIVRRPLFSQLSSLYSILDPEAARDSEISGDIAPGSLEAPKMLPRAASPVSYSDRMKAMLWREDVKKREFGYEGKELELRRPEGMRHWN